MSWRLCLRGGIGDGDGRGDGVAVVGWVWEYIQAADAMWGSGNIRRGIYWREVYKDCILRILRLYR